MTLDTWIRDRRMPDALRWLAVAACVAAIGLASWLPSEIVVRTGHLSGRSEHMLAYALLTIAVASLSPVRLSACPLFTALVALAVIFETGQLLVPGRVASVGDALASTVGIALGLAAFHFLSTVRPLRARSA